MYQAAAARSSQRSASAILRPVISAAMFSIASSCRDIFNKTKSTRRWRNVPHTGHQGINASRWRYAKADNSRCAHGASIRPKAAGIMITCHHYRRVVSIAIFSTCHADILDDSGRDKMEKISATHARHQCRHGKRRLLQPPKLAKRNRRRPAKRAAEAQRLSMKSIFFIIWRHRVTASGCWPAQQQTVNRHKPYE